MIGSGKTRSVRGNRYVENFRKALHYAGGGALDGGRGRRRRWRRLSLLSPALAPISQRLRSSSATTRGEGTRHPHLPPPPPPPPFFSLFSLLLFPCPSR